MKKKPSPKKVPKKRKPGLTPKQKRLIQLMPKIAAGKMTKKDAILQAGYKESVAKQQGDVLGSTRKNTVMQEALRKANVTEDRLAATIDTGIRKPDGYRYHYVKLAAELLDAFPTKKADLTLHGVEDLLDEAEGEGEHAAWSTPEAK